MTPREVINEAASHGVALSIHDGRLRYQGEAQAVAAILPLLQEHKTAILNELTGGLSGSPLSIPPTMPEDLLCCGYHSPEWTPAGCRRFLAELQAEWPGFEVRGWHGLTMPECWPVALMDSVQSIYVMSIQDQGEA